MVVKARLRARLLAVGHVAGDILLVLRLSCDRAVAAGTHVRQPKVGRYQPHLQRNTQGIGSGSGPGRATSVHTKTCMAHITM